LFLRLRLFLFFLLFFYFFLFVIGISHQFRHLVHLLLQLLPTFKVTWVKAGTSSVFGLESLRELRVQGAVGMGNGFGPSLTHGGRKVVLCGG
ncbi:hypothetical protein ALC53_05643, partial [Atta colombica]